MRTSVVFYEEVRSVEKYSVQEMFEDSKAVERCVIGVTDGFIRHRLGAPFCLQW